MNVDWSPLRQELSAWRAGHLTLRIWWRDDDAIEPTPALETLSTLSDELALPVHLAVVPAHARNNLGTFVGQRTNLVPVVHGWAHANQSPAGAKKAEFNHHRAGAEAELAEAKTRLSTLFQDRLLPMFVPPWNRYASAFDPMLQSLGYCAVSGFGPRSATLNPSGLPRINTHIDPIFWRGTRSLVNADHLIEQTVRNLADRRAGHSDATEPLGYLTHHLVHDAAIWTFSRIFLSELLEGGATPANITALISETP